MLAIDDIAKAPVALHLARMAKRLAERVVIYTNGATELSEQIAAAAGNDTAIALDNRRVARLEKVSDDSSEMVVHLDDGSSASHAFLVHKPKSRVSGPFVEQLGLQLTDAGVIHTTQPYYETSVPGVFAVGDCASPMPAVVNALATGAFAAGGVVAQLGAEI